MFTLSIIPVFYFNTITYQVQDIKESIEYRVKKKKKRYKKVVFFFLSNYPAKVYVNFIVF